MGFINQVLILTGTGESPISRCPPERKFFSNQVAMQMSLTWAYLLDRRDPRDLLWNILEIPSGYVKIAIENGYS